MKPETIGDRIQLLMLKQKVSVCELSQLLGVHRKTLYNWKAGMSEPLSSQVGKMAEIFGVTCDYLISGKPDRKKLRISRRNLL